MERRFLITFVILGTIGMLVLWIIAGAFFIRPQYEIAREAGLESVAETILLLQEFVSFVVGFGCTRLCIKLIDAIKKLKE